MRSLKLLFVVGVVCLGGCGAMAGDRGQSPEALTQLQTGLAYRDGIDRPNDDEQAAYWLAKSAAQGNGKAQLALGGLYSWGRGVPEDNLKAYMLYEQAAHNGEPLAQWLIGQSYEFGIAHASNAKKALYWYRKAAESNDPNAQAALGWMHYSGKWGAKVDYAEARAWFEKAGTRDRSGEAELGMAELHLLGRGGFARSDKAALYWYTEAVGKNNLIGLRWVGAMYHEGRGVEKNDSIAISHWSIAAHDYNDPYAQYMISQLLSKGEKVRIDLPTAYLFALKADRNGFPEAAAAVRELEAKLSEKEKAEMLRALDEGR